MIKKFDVKQILVLDLRLIAILLCTFMSCSVMSLKNSTKLKNYMSKCYATLYENKMSHDMLFL